MRTKRVTINGARQTTEVSAQSNPVLASAVEAKRKTGLSLKDAMAAVRKNKRIMASARAWARQQLGAQPVPAPETAPDETANAEAQDADHALFRRYMIAVCHYGRGGFESLDEQTLADVACLVPVAGSSAGYLLLDDWKINRFPGG